jgi:Family of unknown function (DUF6101)
LRQRPEINFGQRGGREETPAGSAILRRQTHIGGLVPAGSSRAERLDPFTLPVRFAIRDQSADERVRQVEISRERVVHRRAVAGIKMAVNVPVAAYLGVAVRMEPPAQDTPGGVAVVLEHRDPGLSLPLFEAADGTDIVAEWQTWARVLSLPLLVAAADGALREPFARLGAVRIAAPIGRRRRRGSLKRRRPSIFLRRKAGDVRRQDKVHRGEREIIARS